MITVHLPSAFGPSFVDTCLMTRDKNQILWTSSPYRLAMWNLADFVLSKSNFSFHWGIKYFGWRHSTLCSCLPGLYLSILSRSKVSLRRPLICILHAFISFKTSTAFVDLISTLLEFCHACLCECKNFRFDFKTVVNTQFVFNLNSFLVDSTQTWTVCKLPTLSWTLNTESSCI